MKSILSARIFFCSQEKVVLRVHERKPIYCFSCSFYYVLTTGYALNSQKLFLLAWHFPHDWKWLDSTFFCQSKWNKWKKGNSTKHESLVEFTKLKYTTWNANGFLFGVCVSFSCFDSVERSRKKFCRHRNRCPTDTKTE